MTTHLAPDIIIHYRRILSLDIKHRDRPTDGFGASNFDAQRVANEQLTGWLGCSTVSDSPSRPRYAAFVGELHSHRTLNENDFIA